MTLVNSDPANCADNSYLYTLKDGYFQYRINVPCTIDITIEINPADAPGGFLLLT